MVESEVRGGRIEREVRGRGVREVWEGCAMIDVWLCVIMRGVWESCAMIDVWLHVIMREVCSAPAPDFVHAEEQWIVVYILGSIESRGHKSGLEVR